MNPATDERFMRLALEEARKGLGRTHPNPRVGAVVVKGGKIIAAGFHSRAGAPHAEAEALARAGTRAAGATLYSTLEPCNHHGRTPPCTEAIIRAGVARVVYASHDPNPLVDGKGHQRLVSAGISVTAGVLAGVSDDLNRPFFKAVTSGLPYVTLKAAMTLDGKIAARRGEQLWISSDASVLRAHQLRDQVDAIVVGAGTVVSDDPHLTTRLPGGGGKTPVRVVLDSGLRTPPQASVYDSRAGRTILATLQSTEGKKARPYAVRGVEVWSLPARREQVALVPLLRRLAADGLIHVLVEGGAAVHASFLGQRLADEVMLFVAPMLLGEKGLTWTGLLPPGGLTLGELSTEGSGPDLLVRARLPALARPQQRDGSRARASSVAARKQG